MPAVRQISHNNIKTNEKQKAMIYLKNEGKNMNEVQLIIEADKLARVKTSHILHLLLSLLTLGWWVPVWILLGLNNVVERIRIERRIKKLV